MHISTLGLLKLLLSAIPFPLKNPPKSDLTIHNVFHMNVLVNGKSIVMVAERNCGVLRDVDTIPINKCLLQSPQVIATEYPHGMC
jgi:hypothetical protein